MNNNNNNNANNSHHHNNPQRSGRKSIPRGRVITGLVAATAIAVLVTAGSTSSQRRALGEQDVRDALSSQVRKAVSDQQLSVDGALDCTATIDTASKISASCVGTTTTGQAVTGAFIGTADVDKETCTADLTVGVAGTQVVEQPDVHCFTSV